jgi:hypothetical protein
MPFIIERAYTMVTVLLHALYWDSILILVRCCATPRAEGMQLLLPGVDNDGIKTSLQRTG